MQHFLFIVHVASTAATVEFAFTGTLTSEHSNVNNYSLSSSPTNYFQNEFCSTAWPRSSTKSYCKLSCPHVQDSGSDVTSVYVNLVNGHWDAERGGLAVTYPQGKPQGSAPSTDTLYGHVGPYKYKYQGNYECPLWSSHTESAAYSFWVWVPLANRSEANVECAECYYPFFQGAKMPGGLCAGGCYTGEDTEHLTCGDGATCSSISKDNDGSTLRLMWRREGRLAAYVAKLAPYCVKDTSGNWKQPDQYLFVESGDLGGTWLQTPLASSTLPGTKGVLQDGQWNYLEVSLTLNSCDGSTCASDGELSVKHVVADKPAPEVASAATRILYRNDVHWRCLGDTSIDSFILQTFMGGKSSDWAPTVDTSFTYRNFSTWRIIEDLEVSSPLSPMLYM